VEVSWEGGLCVLVERDIDPQGERWMVDPAHVEAMVEQMGEGQTMGEVRLVTTEGETWRIPLTLLLSKKVQRGKKWLVPEENWKTRATRVEAHQPTLI
jgi:hypothetical protein